MTPFPPIPMLNLGEHLRRRRDDGDAEAAELLRLSEPPAMPTRVVLAFRDSRIRRIARLIRDAEPGISIHRITIIIDAAGDAALRRHTLPSRPPFDRFSAEERDTIGALAQELRALCPDRWPCVRQIRRILELDI